MSAELPSACRCGGNVVHLDVRGLSAPAPMVAILRCCAGAAPGAAIVVRLDRDPVFLYPELAEHGWMATRIDGEPGEVRLRIERSAP